MIKKLIIVFLTILPVMAMTARAQTIVDSGTFGDNLTWTLTDYDDGEENTTVYQLSISGNGDMIDSNSNYNLPWYSYRRQIEKVIIADGVTNIGSHVFKDFENLKVVTIPSCVTSIGNSAFADCYKLKEVEIPNSVTSIGGDAFAGCGLTSIVLPNSVTKIESLTFFGCYYLTSITIPNSVTTIGRRSFERCSSLTTVTIPNSVTSIGEMAFDGCTSLTTITLPNSVTSIEDDVFYGCCSLTSVNIPNGVTSIGISAFNGCNSLASIDIPNSVTSIDSYAFSGCSNLTSIDIPNSVISIGSHAFSRCVGLTSISIPKSVTNIDINPFTGCSGLKKLTVESGNPNYDSRDNCNGIIETKTNSLISGLQNTIVPSTVTCIGNYAFQSCGFTVFNIPNTITSIGERAFEGCSSLTSFTIPNSVTSIGEHAFEGCSGLTSIDIPNSVTSIGDEAFSKCSGLTSVHISNSVSCLRGTFNECSSLTSVIIPNSVETVEYSAFFGCTSLTLVTLPNSLKKIGYMAFEDCHSLESITIPRSVKEIDTRAFNDCEKLTSITCLALNPPECTWGYFVSYNKEPEITLYVPTGYKEKYAAVEPWSKFKEIIEIDVDMELELVLTATENDGLVTLRFDAVCHDLRHRIIRVDENGVKAKVESKEGCSFPATIEYVDNPPAGTYTYYAQTVYIDGNGESVSLMSNEVIVTVAEPQTEEQEDKDYVSLLGSIEYDKNMPATGVKVKFSDGVTVDVVGSNFKRAKVPVDTDITLTVVGDASHDYEPMNLHIERHQKPILLKGVYKPDFVATEETNDLALCSPVEVTTSNGEHFATFTVKNLSADHAWEGCVTAKAIKKSLADKGNDITTLEGNGQRFLREPLFYKGYDCVTVKKGSTEQLKIKLQNLSLKEDTEFYIYLVSEGRWEDGNELTSVKPLAVDGASTVEGNPLATIIGKTEEGAAGARELTDEEKEDVAYFVLGQSSVTPGMDGIVGDLSAIQKIMLRITGKKTASEAAEVLYNWFGGGSIAEAINDPNFRTISSEVKAEIWKIYSNGITPFTQTYWRKLVGSFADVANADLTIGLLHDLLTATTSNDQFEQVMACAGMIYQLTAGQYVPLSSMMYSYMAVGKALIAAARQFSPIMEKRYLTSRLIQNKPYHGNDENRVNEAIDFKIYIKTGKKDKTRINFTNGDVARQIVGVSIKAAHRQGTTPAEFAFNPIWKEDCIMLQSDGKGMVPGSGVVSEGNEVAEFYMEIKWSNGRTTLIPLLENSGGGRTDGVKFDQNGAHMDTYDKFYEENPWVYTVTLTTTTGEDAMADELYLGNNKKRD